jgi:putative ABC transport system permease protein
LFGRTKIEAELNEELQYHLDREIQRAIDAGMHPEEARYAALRSIAAIEQRKEECRDARSVRWLEDSMNDVRFAIRTLRKAPAFTVTVIAALAFCIGLNTAIFSIVDTVLFRPLPFPDQDRLVAVTEGVPGLGFPVLPFSPPDYLFVAANNRSFAGTAIYRTQTYEISGAGQPRRLYGARVTASLFRVLRVPPAIGRAFTQEEDEHTKRLAILTYALAQSTFGKSETALGRTILVDRNPYSVIGVMPRSFSFPIRGSRFANPADLFIPVSWNHEDRRQNVSNFDYSMVARLRPNVSVQQASTELRGLLKRIVKDYPPPMKQALSKMPNFSLESEIVPFREEFTGNVERPLLLLLAAVGVLLAIGCADVANLMFSRMVGRQREFALRSALGAGRWRLARQTIAEGLVLSVAGGTAGFCLAFWALPLLIRFVPDSLPRLNEIGLNWRMLAFVVVVTLATPVLFCLGPLLTTFRSTIVNQLRGEGRTTTENKHRRLMMSAAVVAQFSLAFLLVTTAGLLTQSLIKATATNPGFQSEHILSVSIALPKAAYTRRAEVTGFLDRLLSYVDTLPGIQQTGAISDLPLNSTSNVVISIEGHGKETERVDMLFCRGNALEALHTLLMRGRLLRPEDQIGQPHSVVISQTLAKRVWPRDNPIGRRIRFGVDVPNNNEPWLTVVGVVADLKARLNSDSPRSLLFTTWPDWLSDGNLIVRTSGDPLLSASAIRREINRLDSNLPVGKIETMDQVLQESLSAERFRTWLLVCFAVAALLLATLGIGGLLAHNAAQRIQEFGVRIALGANHRDLLLMVFQHCLRLSGAGIAIGLAASMAVTRAISTLLYDTSALDPGTFLAVALILVAVAFVAALLPAWRVVRTDPMTALRAE